MEIMLAENIRKYRKERSLTQEQLAEVLGVTAGAVYKWEARLSLPELELIVRMADFFDVSVDVLLGYEIKDNRPEATVRRLRDLRRDKDRAGLTEAEKALKKYPHSFKIVYECAAHFLMFGIESGDKAMLRRALDLLEQCRLLLPQNEDPEISEQTLYDKMAKTYLGLDESEKAAELWKTHNAGGLYDHSIGHCLALIGHIDEASPFLSEALAKIVADLCDTVIGFMNVFLTRGDYVSAEAILRLGIGFFSGLRKENKANYLDKVGSALRAALAGCLFLAGREDEARAALESAKELADFFDRSPSYDENDVLFLGRIEGASAYDDIGATAADAIDTAVSGFENAAFTELWNSVAGQKEEYDHE